MKNHLPVILVNQRYNSNKGMAVYLQTGDYWYSMEANKTQNEKRVILVALPAVFVGINMLGGLTIKAINSWLGYKR